MMMHHEATHPDSTRPRRTRGPKNPRRRGFPPAMGHPAHGVADPVPFGLEPLEPRILLSAQVVVPIDDVVVDEGAAPIEIELSEHLDDTEIEGTVVRFQSVLGDYFAELFDALVPQTVANFLNYVNDGDYANSFIHRLATNFVIQGGAFTFQAPDVYDRVPTDAPVPNEFSNHAVASGTGAAVTSGSAVVQLPGGTDLGQAQAGDRIRLVGRTDGVSNPDPLDFFDIVSVNDANDTVQVSPTPTAASQGGLE